ncbi:MAG: hypothetical protein V3W41_16500 [Planctomycetota bacterium]
MNRDDDVDITRFTRLIQAELDGEISAEDEAHLQQVLAERPELSQLYDEEKRLSRLFAEDREEFARAPAGLALRINAAIAERAPVGGKGKLIAFSSLVRPLAAAAAILVLVTGAFWSGRTTTSAQVPDFEERVLEKFRDSVKSESLDPEQADALLATFKTESERIKSEKQAELRKVARDLEQGLQSLVEKRRRR